MKFLEEASYDYSSVFNIIETILNREYSCLEYGKAEMGQEAEAGQGF